MRPAVSTRTNAARHLLVEYSGCEGARLDDTEGVKAGLLAAAAAANTTVLDSWVHRFEPQGISAVVAISESHLSIHTWPELGYAALDVYTCGAEAEPDRAIAVVAEALGAQRAEVVHIERGGGVRRGTIRLLERRVLSAVDGGPLREAAEVGSGHFTVRLADGTTAEHEVRRWLSRTRSEYQRIEVFESDEVGVGLLLDRQIQSTSNDEAHYHEPLVHVPCVLHGAPRRVLILGGGEGATLREVLRWRSVERAVMVEIDREVVECAKAYLQPMHEGAFDDPRAEVIIGDAMAFLRDSDERWDVIIGDLTDPAAEGPARGFHGARTFADVQRALLPGGVYALQIDEVWPDAVEQPARLLATARGAFTDACLYQAYVPSFPSPWGFIVAADAPITPRLDAQAAQRTLDDQVVGALKTMDGVAVTDLFRLPLYLRRRLEQPAAPLDAAAPLEGDRR